MSPAANRDRFTPSTRLRRATAAAIFVSLVVFGAACGGGDANGSTGEGAAGATAKSGSADGGAVGPGLRGDTLVVDLADFAIVVPDTLPAGELRIVARNVGLEEHNFEIMQGSEVLWEFDEPVQPQQTQSARLTLEPGVYSVYCTVSGHDGRGMLTEIVVVEVPDS